MVKYQQFVDTTANTHLSRAFDASCKPWASPSCFNAVFKTSCRAEFMSVGPPELVGPSSL